jgi:uncharacterized protein
VSLDRTSHRDEWLVKVGPEATHAVLDRADTPSTLGLFVFSHGAGGNMADRGMGAITALLCSCGLDVLRFNFLYAEKGSRRPDPTPRLKECVAAVAGHASEALRPSVLVLGGRSMGGRAGSMLAADGYPCQGLLLLAYPLHPAGQPEKLRDAHLPKITVPVLCFNGTRDSLCRRDLMQAAVQGLGDRWTMHWLEGADHGFHVLKSSGRSDADVLTEIGRTTAAWMKGLAARSE